MELQKRAILDSRSVWSSQLANSLQNCNHKSDTALKSRGKYTKGKKKVIWAFCADSVLMCTCILFNKWMFLLFTHSRNTSCYNSTTLTESENSNQERSNGSTCRESGPITDLNLNSAPVPRSEFHHWRHWEQSDTISKKEFGADFQPNAHIILFPFTWNGQITDPIRHFAASPTILMWYYGLRNVSYDMRKKSVQIFLFCLNTQMIVCWS